MRADIEYLFKPDEILPLKDLRMLVTRGTYGDYLSDVDKGIIDKEWDKVKVRNPQAFSRPRSLATLNNVRDGILLFEATEFKEYMAVTHTSEERSMSPAAYLNMRVGAVAAALEVPGEKIFVHRRSYDATHVPGMLDSSTAGVCFVQDYMFLDPKASILNKSARELRLEENEVQVLGTTGVHSAEAPDFSGMINVAIRTDISESEMRDRIAKAEVDISELFFVPRLELDDFVYEHLVMEKDMVGDGAMTLLSMLPNDEFSASIDKLRRSGVDIQFGRLSNFRLVV